MTGSSSLLSWTVPFLVLLLAGLLTRFHLQRKAYRRESEKIRGLQEKIQAVLEDPSVPFDASLRHSLQRAGRETGPLQPDIRIQADMTRETPEKYRILTHMAARGMTAEEIAAILGISTTEAGQLVNLSSMAGWID